MDQAFEAFGSALAIDPRWFIIFFCFFGETILGAGMIIQDKGDYDIALAKYRCVCTYACICVYLHLIVCELTDARSLFCCFTIVLSVVVRVAAAQTEFPELWNNIGMCFQAKQKTAAVFF
jgi:hypothetical protein